MSSLNRSLLRRDGYVILRNVIPAEELDAMREASEAILDRQREIWRREAGPDDPPGGVWDTRPQPRVSDMERLVDADTARAVELWLGEPVLGVCRELLCLPEASPMLMTMMCNPRTDHGPAKWHRDIHPIDMAPLRLLQAEILETGPRYLQWNVPLYDDDVLWVVPGSHCRLNTPEEERQLEEDPRAPLPGGVPVDLKAGDGVVYNNCMLHWGSNYAPKLRRTLHGGHAVQAHPRDIGFARHLSPPARAAFESWSGRAADQRDLTERALRAVLGRDAPAFHGALESLLPGAGPAAKLVLTVFLCKAAQHIHQLKQPDFDELSPELRLYATYTQPFMLNWGASFARRFTDAEADELWRRFDWLESRLLADTIQPVTGLQGSPNRYYQNDLPEPVAVDEFVASWAA